MKLYTIYLLIIDHVHYIFSRIRTINTNIFCVLNEFSLSGLDKVIVARKIQKTSPWVSYHSYLEIFCMKMMYAYMYMGFDVILLIKEAIFLFIFLTSYTAVLLWLLKVNFISHFSLAGGGERRGENFKSVMTTGTDRRTYMFLILTLFLTKIKFKNKKKLRKACIKL